MTTENSLTYSALTKDEDIKNEITGSVVYFILEGDKVIGDISYTLKQPDHAYISGLLIHPDFRSKGVARQAMNWLLEKDLKNVSTIDLVTHPHNTGAIKLYLSLGFVIDGWKDNYFGDGQPRIYMIRKTTHV
jgi:ribosomal protein S18 acetylase RimI-like enzyme